MTTLSLTAGATTRDQLETAGQAALLGAVASLQISIAAAQGLLAIAAGCWLALHVLRRERVEAPAFFWPLVGYAAATLASAGSSTCSSWCRSSTTSRAAGGRERC